jgi:hypothetical protein
VDAFNRGFWWGFWWFFMGFLVIFMSFMGFDAFLLLKWGFFNSVKCAKIHFYDFFNAFNAFDAFFIEMGVFNSVKCGKISFLCIFLCENTNFLCKISFSRVNLPETPIFDVKSPFLM